jgi:hypothetical protein
MPDRTIPQDITLSQAAKAFIAATSTESGDHIRPLNRYLAMRLVIEGGFLPEEISPRPPTRSEYRNGVWYLSFDLAAESNKEQIVLGALKSKRIDIVVAKDGIGPLLAVSVKGTSKAFRNLVNRTEEAIGDCAKIHIMYPGLVYGFVHFLRATDASDRKLKPNDILLGEDGEVIGAVKDYARILEGLAGRKLVRNDYSRYEAVSLALLAVNVTGSQSPLIEKFPGSNSSLSLTSFFGSLYHVYDLRFSYAYTDPGVRQLGRVSWAPDSPALISLQQNKTLVGLVDYKLRVSDD